LAGQIDVDLSFGRFARKHSSWYYTRVITGFDDNQDLSIVKAAIIPLIMICELENAGRDRTWDRTILRTLKLRPRNRREERDTETDKIRLAAEN
jgi:hypothetical protein